jgi:transposase-like protein
LTCMLLTQGEAGMPRRYPPEFRRKVLDLLKAGRTVTQVAADLQISDQTIYNWLQLAAPRADRHRPAAGPVLQRPCRAGSTGSSASAHRRAGNRTRGDPAGR